jgi:MerR family transcriptional regulator, heat shock protein HspR
MRTETKNSSLYSIGEVAQMLEVSVQTLRLYEERGLVLVKKSAGNQRLYTQDDIDRIRCIRKAINEEKISIEGIRRIQSLVPCWAHIQCSEEEKQKCPAFHRVAAGCWTYKDKQSECADRDCRSCKVYLQSGDCQNIKLLMYHRE